MAKIAADVWLALGVAAEQHGGVGRGSLRWDGQPCCIFGIAADLDGLTEAEAEKLVYGDIGVRTKKPAEVMKALMGAGVTWRESDVAVRAAAEWWQERVPFEAWAQAIELEPDTEN